ncbi:MAG: type IX secretion system sortase PorU, partial [Bacteroidales bacterium]
MYTKKNVFIILLCLVSFISQAQLKVSEHRISWYPELKAFLPDTQERIAFENFAMMDEYKELPCYIVPLNEYSTEKEVSVYLSNEQVREATPQETAYLQMYEDLIAPEFNIRSQIQEYRYEFRTIACVLPIRKNQSTGNYELLTTFKLLSNTKNTDSLSVFNSKNNSSIPKNESVLAQAPFFKLRIQQNGIYRLTFQEMKKYGILQDEIKSSQIALFGNPAGMLANDNKNEKYNDDLMEIPIAIYDGGDGQFNANDYLLFYGQSATTWQWDQKVEEANFTHQVNYYDDYTYYFLSANYTQGTRKRIQDAVEVNMLPSKTIQQFIDYQYYEKDLFNPCNEGQNWVGEIFREQGAVHDFDFVFPDIILDSVIKINMALAASSASTFTLSSTQAFLAEDSMAANLNVQISLSENFCLATQSAQYRCKLRQNTPRFRLKYSKENAVISDGYLDYFNFQYYRKLKIAQGFLSFRSPEAIKNVVKFQIESLYGSVQVWKIDSLWNIENIKVTQKDKLYSFVRKDDHLAEFIAFDGNTFLSLKALDIQKIDTQNLHALNSIEYVIVAHPDFQKEAQELGELHRQNNVKTAVLLTTQVYNEFSAGIVDPSAIRRLMKMLYDKAQENKELTPPSYLLLFGDASYDVKNVLNKNSNFIPTFEPVSNGSGDGDVGDDDFAYLGTNESSANAMPDIAVGRLPVSSTEQAQNVLAKIKRYMHPYLYKEETMDQTSLNFGDWKNVITFISDDGERFDQRYEDSGQFASAIYKEEPQMNIKKIYSDAYQRYSTPKGATYPDARKALHEGMDKGALFVGYMGHSGWNAWSDEKILILEDIYKWKNSYAYPMMFSSSCTFSYFDQVAQISGGELCVLTPNGGAISMVAASRTANIGSIEKIQSDFVRYAIQKQEGIPPSIGDAYLYTK